jgi:2-polyprenyl-3-methyl-5-hydroxy-6-metoxy-1,4-benzoquinol methylase
MTAQFREIQSCEVCNFSDFTGVFEGSKTSSAVDLCNSCGLMFSNPALELSAIQDFYDEEFSGDSGGGGAQNSNKKKVDFQSALRKVDKKIMPLILRHISNLDGLNIVEFRARQGALAVALQTRGAIVRATDPMVPNVMQGKQNGAPMEHLKVVDHLTLPNFPLDYFDAAICLTIHVLAHLPEPSKFLARLYDVLKPGGLLFIDEKNVLKPEKITSHNIFESGVGHFFHFSPDALLSMVTKAGFEVVENDIDGKRKSAFGHISLVARKPLVPAKSPYILARFGKNELLANVRKANKLAAQLAWKNILWNRLRKLAKF